MASSKDGVSKDWKGKEELFIQALRSVFESLITSPLDTPSNDDNVDTRLNDYISSDQGVLVVSCIVTLCKILDNILLESKYNPKTRTIKLSNRLFCDKIGTVPGGGKFMLFSLTNQYNEHN